MTRSPQRRSGSHAVEKLARSTSDLVATVGKVNVKPNAGNVIPGSVELSLDVRHAQDRARRAAVRGVVARRHSPLQTVVEFTVEWTTKMDEPAVPMDERLTSYLSDAMEAAGLPAKTMPSGAGHDAMVMAAPHAHGDALSAQPGRHQPQSRRDSSRRRCGGGAARWPQIS